MAIIVCFFGLSKRTLKVIVQIQVGGRFSNTEGS